MNDAERIVFQLAVELIERAYEGCVELGDDSQWLNDAKAFLKAHARKEVAERL